MLRKDAVQDSVGVEEVAAEDGVDAGDGGAEVFGDEFGGGAGLEGDAGGAEGGRCLEEGIVVPFVCDEDAVKVGDKVFLGLGKGRFQFLNA